MGLLLAHPTPTVLMVPGDAEGLPCGPASPILIEGTSGTIFYCPVGGTTYKVVPPGAFLDHLDTPNEFTGHGGKFVAVRGAEDALEFVLPGHTAPGGAQDTLQFNDSGQFNGTDAMTVNVFGHSLNADAWDFNFNNALLYGGTIGRLNNSTDPAFVLNAQDGSHTGNYLDLQDNGTTRLYVDNDWNMIFPSLGVLHGGIFQGGVTPATYAATTTQPQNAIFKNYNGALAASKQYSAMYINPEIKHNNLISNSDIFGLNTFVKVIHGNTMQIRGVYGARFLAQATAYGGSSLIDTMAGGEFATSLGSTGAETISHYRAGMFKAGLSGGSNKTITNAYTLYVEGGAGAGLSAGTTVANMAGIRITDLRNDLVGATTFDAIKVDSQTPRVGFEGSDGNVHLSGGQWNSGHHQIDTIHLWADKSTAGGPALRASTSAPTSASNGVNLTPTYWTGYEAGVTTVTTTSTTIDIDNEGDPFGLYDLAAGEVTVNRTGIFAISYNVSFEKTSGGTDILVVASLEVNAVLVAGSPCVLQLPKQGDGASCGSRRIVALTTGDVVRVRGIASSGTAETYGGGSALNIEEK